MRILLIESEDFFAQSIRQFLQREFHIHIDIAPSIDEGIEQFEKEKYQYVMVDADNKQYSAKEVMQKIKVNLHDTPCIVFTSDREKVLDYDAPIVQVIEKPFDLYEVMSLILLSSKKRREE